MQTVTIVTVGEMAISDRLTMLREQRGWSMGMLAARSRVSRAAISRIESGDTPSPGASTLEKLADALGVDLSEITGERPMPRRRVEVFEGVAMVPLMRVRVSAGEPVWDDTRES